MIKPLPSAIQSTRPTLAHFSVPIGSGLPPSTGTFTTVEYPGPAFLEVVIDQNACVYPMIGPGSGYKEMVTGDFIPARAVAAQGAGKADLF